MRKCLIIAAMALMGASCSEKNIDLPTNQIKITASLPGATKATLTNFVQGDQMSLYAVEYDGDNVASLQISGNYLNNERMTYNNNAWENNRTMYWSENACDFYAIYPYQEPAAINDLLFEVETDQSTPKTDEGLGGYEKSDLMWAKAEKITKESNGGKVDLQFTHMMSRLVVDIKTTETFEGEIPDDITTHIYNTATIGIVDYTNGSVEKYAYSPKKTITMNKISNNRFEAIVIPQFIERSTQLIEMTMGGIAYLFTSEPISFRPGYQYTLEITLSKSPDQENIEISIGGEIEGWN